jgi:hypothetical protein
MAAHTVMSVFHGAYTSAVPGDRVDESRACWLPAGGIRRSGADRFHWRHAGT